MKTEKLEAKIAKLKVELQDLLDANPQLAEKVETNEILPESQRDTVEN